MAMPCKPNGWFAGSLRTARAGHFFFVWESDFLLEPFFAALVGGGKKGRSLEWRHVLRLWMLTCVRSHILKLIALRLALIFFYFQPSPRRR